MNPAEYYQNLRKLFPQRVMPIGTDCAVISGISELQKLFPAVYASSTVEINIPVDSYPKKHAEAVTLMNAIFQSPALPEIKKWRDGGTLNPIIEREKHTLKYLLETHHRFDLANAWVKPAVSRIMFHCAFGDMPEAGSWDEELYEAAYVVVNFLDGKFDTESEFLDGLYILNSAIQKRLSLTGAHEKTFLSKFLMFATGHETPANLVCNLLTNHGSWRSGDKVSALVAEAIRFDPPIQCLTRKLARNITIGSCILDAGTTVKLHVGLASRDENAFSWPDAFRIDNRRMDYLPLFFGSPEIGCPGRNVAYIITMRLFEVIRDFMSEIEVADVKWRSTDEVRGISELHISRTASGH